MYLTLDIFHENASRGEILALEQSYIDLLDPWTNINSSVISPIDPKAYNKLSKSQHERITAIIGIPVFVYYKNGDSLLLIRKLTSTISFIEVTGVGWGTLQNYLNTNKLLHPLSLTGQTLHLLSKRWSSLH